MVSRSSPSHLRQARAEFKDSARHVWLAGIGALAKAKDEGGRLFESLVERGREVESHTVPMLNGLRRQAADLLTALRRTVSPGPARSGARRGPRKPRRSAAVRKRKPAASTAKRASKASARGKPKVSPRRS
jgi:hypothetical protein